MKNKNVVKKITAILATACMMVGMLATTAMAKPAENQQGSLTIQTSSQQSSLAGYQFDLYKIANISVNNSTGNMTYIQNIKTGGEQPRFITLNPEGTRLLAANELSDTITVFEILKDGTLKDTGRKIATESPVCIAWKTC